MESVSECMYRSDGTKIRGLDSSQWKTYKETYSNIPEEELIFLRDTTDELKDTPSFNTIEFECVAEELDFHKGREKMYGLPATISSPLFMLLSVHVKPKRETYHFSVYGDITTHGGLRIKKEFIYKKEFQDVEHFGSDGGYLTLDGPHEPCWAVDVYTIFESKKLSIKLYDETQTILVDRCVELVYSENEFEEVKDLEVHSPEYLLTFKYVSIPMAVYGSLRLLISNKRYLGKHANFRDSVNVCGKMVATYTNTFGNYNSEEIVLFDKNPDEEEYETVFIESSDNLLSLTRRWVALPVYSSLHVHLDLFEYGTNKPILKEDVELETHDAYGYSKELVTDEFFVSMLAAWFPPPLRKLQDSDDSDQEEHEDADDSGQGESEDGGGDGVQVTGISEPCTVPAFLAFEVFSVNICHNLHMPLKINGLFQFTSLDCNDGGINIFKKDEKDPLSLPGRGNTISAVNGSRFKEAFNASSVVCDLKDTLSKLSIKGYLGSHYARGLPQNRQLCSIFRGDRGFAALHYAIFPCALQANLMVSCTENGLKCMDSPVSGSFCVQYNDFDYSSGYEKNRYKIVLFKIEEHDSVQIDANGFIPLSRSSVIVPSHSSLLFDVQLMIGTQKLSGKGSIKVDTGSMSIKKDQHEVKIDLNWCEVE